MVGPGHDRDLFLTGNLTFDFLARRIGPRRGSVNPFLVAGGEDHETGTELRNELTHGQIGESCHRRQHFQ